MGVAIVLGSGQDGGAPQFGSTDAVVGERTASSLAVLAGDTALLLDASPDLRTQWRRLLDVPEYRHRSGAPFDGVVLTHGHMGHYAGLVHFGKEALASEAVPLWATPRMVEFLAGNAPWSALLSGGHLAPRPIEPGDPAEVGDGLTIRLIPVPHRAEFTDTVAVSVNERLLYLPDIDGWEEWAEAEEVVSRHDVAFVDATFFDRDEIDRWERVRHPPVTDTIDRFAHLTDRTTVVLTHLNHTNPVGSPHSEERALAEAAGFVVADDGERFAW